MSNEAFRSAMENATTTMIARAVENMNTACLVVERKAKVKCPVDMGILRGSMFSKVSLSGGRIVGRIGNQMEYAPYVHQGTGIYATDGNGRQTPWGYMVLRGKYAGFHITHGQKPQPFLDKAKIEEKDRISFILGGVENA